VLAVLAVIGLQLSTVITVPAVVTVPWVTGGVYFRANIASGYLTEDDDWLTVPWVTGGVYFSANIASG
jgi:hypothetical protein